MFMTFEDALDKVQIDIIRFSDYIFKEDEEEL